MDWKTLVLALLAYTPFANASFFALCDFEIELTRREYEMVLIAGAAYQRNFEGKIVSATDTQQSHVDCAAVYLNKIVAFPLQVKRTEESLKRLGEIKPGDHVAVSFVKTDSLTPWGVLSSEDWLLKGW